MTRRSPSSRSGYCWSTTSCRIEQLAIDNPQAPEGLVTMSFGVATMVPSKAGSADALIALADNALYTAKNEGRNGVAVAPMEAS